MNAPDVLKAVQNAGGSLMLNGERIRYVLPDSEEWLVKELTRNKDEIVVLLKGLESPPLMPAGVRLLQWNPKTPPVAIIHMGVVTDVRRFVTATLLQLKAQLEGRDFLAGNWSIRDLVDRLEQVGVRVEIEHNESVTKEKA